MNQIQMAARLYDMRDTAKRLLGDAYPLRVNPLATVLAARAAAEKRSVLATAIHVCQTNSLSDIDLMLVMAAVVEIEEAAGVQRA